MVTIKVQSVEDIIKAYLLSLGLDKNEAEASAKHVLTDDAKKSKDIVSSLDEMILKKASEAFDDEGLDDEQLIALFKFCFIHVSQKAIKIKAVFGGSALSDEFIGEMKKHLPQVVPQSNISHMKPQPIEPITTKSIFKKLIGKIWKK